MLRRIRDALDHGGRPKPLSVGLTAKEFREMAYKELLELTHSEDEPKWADYMIGSLSDEALGMIANAEPLPESRAAKTCRVLGIGLWDLVKMPIAFLVGWYLKKYFP